MLISIPRTPLLLACLLLFLVLSRDSVPFLLLSLLPRCLVVFSKMHSTQFLVFLTRERLNVSEMLSDASVGVTSPHVKFAWFSIQDVGSILRSVSLEEEEQGGMHTSYSVPYS